MAGRKSVFVAVVLLAGTTWGQAVAAMRPMQPATKPAIRPTPKPAAAKRLTAKKAEPVPATQPVQQQTPAPAAIPLRPSQMPAVPPRVSLERGMLTIVAENSTMADILAQLRAATGIKIETIGGPSGERVAARIGPAPVRDVILSLVQGSQYDFIILGVEGHPDAVERVILTPKTATGAGAASVAQQSTPSYNTVYQAPVPEPGDDDGNEGFATPPPPSQAQPTPNDPNAPAKTPEQLLEELRRMEEQRNNPQGRPQRPPR